MGDMFAVGACDCSCISGHCTQGTIIPIAPSDSCCWCSNFTSSSLNPYFTLDVAVNGNSVFPATSVNSTGFIGCIPLAGGGSCSLQFSVISTYWGITISNLTGSNCTGSTIGFNCILDYTQLISYSCNPTFNAKYAITSVNCNVLYALGVRSITVTTASGDPLCVTCSACPSGVPYNLYITDGNGSYTATYTTVSPGPGWVTPILCAVSVANCSACSGSSNTCIRAPANGQPAYFYVIKCVSSGLMSITMYYAPLGCSGIGTLYEQCCTGISYAGLGGLSGPSSGSVAVTCGSISWSGSLTHGNVLALPNPVGGSVSFSQ